MGVASSTPVSALGENPVLKRFVGADIIPADDKYWDDLLNFNLICMRNSAEGHTIEESLLGLFAQYAANGARTNHLMTMLSVLSKHVDKLQAAGDKAKEITVWRAYNALLIVRLILKFAVETLPPHQLAELLLLENDDLAAIMSFSGLTLHEALSAPNSKPSIGTDDMPDRRESDIADSHARHPSVPDVLAKTLFKLLIEVPVSELAYGLHLEALTTLLVMMGHAMYVAPAGSSTVVRALLDGACTERAGELVDVLLRNFVQQMEPPQPASGILSLFAFSGPALTFPYMFSQSELTKKIRVGDDSLLVLLSLLYARAVPKSAADDRASSCPFRIAVSSLADHPNDASGLTFAHLYDVICRRLQEPAVVLLLYSLLHDDSNFLGFVLSRTDLESMLVPLLKHIQAATPDSTSATYVALACLLLMSQDDSFNHFVHEQMMPDIVWYIDKAAVALPITMGSMLVLCVVHAVQSNIAKAKDIYLQTMCLAIVANMSTSFKNLHAYVAQRLLRLLTVLSKRFSKLEGIIHAPDSAQEDQEEALLYADFIRIVLEIVATATTQGVQLNPHLIYTLLHKRELLAPFRAHAHFSEAAKAIDEVLDQFQEHLEAQHPDHKQYHSVFATVEAFGRHFPKHNLKKRPCLMFQYQQQFNAQDDFFTAFVWTVIRASAPTFFSRRAMRIHSVDVGR